PGQIECSTAYERDELIAELERDPTGILWGLILSVRSRESRGLETGADPNHASGVDHSIDRAGRRGASVIPSSVRIFVCQQPQDMRRSFDGPRANCSPKANAVTRTPGAASNETD